MIKQKFADLYDDNLAKDAILHDEYIGFKEDYLILHILLKKYKPKSVFEVGTNLGKGTKIIKNALGYGSMVYSLDLPTELANLSKQHPINEGKGDNVGSACDLHFTQLRGDSLNFKFENFPCEAYFIDGEHDFIHPYVETKKILELNPSLIIWHDADMMEVHSAIENAFIDTDNYKNYTLYRVEDTRIAYAVLK